MEIIFKLFLALLAGLIIGFVNRYQFHRESTTPIRVFAMICLGATLITITSAEFLKEFSSSLTGDPGRLSGQVVSALGFLGTGIIWMSEEEGKLKGVYVVASLWVTAIIGMLIGVGLHSATVLGILFIIIIYRSYNLIDYKKKLNNNKAKE
ncbi:MAG TPA: MgtC/SapB family protein [Syntrophomonadaceae bacterium]|nr:MgtC/SapB family protein [Syntrophomonadaceae bacterium]